MPETTERIRGRADGLVPAKGSHLELLLGLLVLPFFLVWRLVRFVFMAALGFLLIAAVFGALIGALWAVRSLFPAF
jgi:membrane associated rhomboid family serine protease